MSLLSIITPTYNASLHIESCILNVTSQQCSDVEHIIIDGGSTDGTIEIISKYADKSPHIRWISEKDSGQSDAMNKGIKMAKSEYISFLNADDFYQKNTLSDIINILSKSKPPEFLVGNCNVWDKNRDLVYINRPRKLRPWHILSGQFLPVNPSAYFYQKKLHNKAGYYAVENYYNMDIEFIIMASTVTKMKYFDQLWGNFLILPNSKTGSDAKAGNMIDRKNDLINKKLKELGIYIQLRTKIYLYYIHYRNIIKRFTRA